MEKKLVKVIKGLLKTNQFRMHPNGFYQLDIGNNSRLHIWPPEKQEHQKNYNPIHDHTFSFDSFILIGHLKHYEYDYMEDEDGEYQMYNVIPVEGNHTIMEPTGKFINIIKSKEMHLLPGSRYTFEKHKFHESVNEKGVLTATIMKKTQQGYDLRARIIGIRNHDPDDNSFDRTKIDQDKAHMYLEDVLANTGKNILYGAHKFIKK